MPAFSSSSPSCQPSFVGKRLLVLSSTNPTDENASPDPVLDTGGVGDIQHHLVDPPTENLLLRPQDYLSYSPLSCRKRPPICADRNRKLQRPPLRQPIKTSAMNATYPGHLVPSDHPILDDFFKPRTSSHAPVTLRSFAKEVPTAANAPSNSNIVSSDSTNERTEKRKSKRFNQPAARYRTTPVTLEEIREIDEEIYAKQQPAKKDEPSDDSINNGGINGKRTSPYSATFGIHGPKKHFSNGSLDFKCTFMTKTKLLPGRALWTAQQSRHRSQESLVHIGLNPLPTIPEELRQQQQQQKSTAGNTENASSSGPISPVTVIVQSPTDENTSSSSPISPRATETCLPPEKGSSNPKKSVER